MEYIQAFAIGMGLALLIRIAVNTSRINPEPASTEQPKPEQPTGPFNLSNTLVGLLVGLLIVLGALAVVAVLMKLT